MRQFSFGSSYLLRLSRVVGCFSFFEGDLDVVVAEFVPGLGGTAGEKNGEEEVL